MIRLARKVYARSFSLEHISRHLALLGHVDSAPRDFSVYALADENDTIGVHLGTYTYDAETGDTLQQYEAVKQESDEPIQFIELRILSNWGNPDYTCIYRFRVHGEPYID